MAPQWNQKNSKKGQTLKPWEMGWGRGRWGRRGDGLEGWDWGGELSIKTQWRYSVSGRKLRVLGLFSFFSKSRFLILNSADMLSLRELKTFIWRLELFFFFFEVRFQNQKRTICKWSGRWLTRDSGFWKVWKISKPMLYKQNSHLCLQI